MKKLFVLFGFFLAASAQAASTTITAPNLNQNVTGTSLGGGHYGLDISGTINASNPSVSTTGTAVPASATFMGVQSGSNLVGLAYGQALMAASLPVTIASNQSALAVTGTFWQATQPISAASLPLPTGASTSALQTTGNSSLSTIATNIPAQGQALAAASMPVVLPAAQITTLTPPTTVTVQQATAANLNATVVGPSGVALAKDSSLTTINTTLGSPFQAGGSIGNTAFGITGAIPAGTNIIGKVGIDQTTPGTTNGVVVNAALPAGANTIGSVTIAPAVTGSGSAAAATVSTVATLTAPSNAIGFILMNLDTSTANIRWAVGRTASATLGQQLQPGRDTGFVPIGANVSIIAESGTQNYDIQFIAK